MKNTILATLTVILGVAVFSVCFSPNKKFKQKVILDPTIKVINLTSDRSVDTIVNITAQILQLKNILIVCVPIVDEEEAATYFAYVQDKEDHYLMKIHSNLSENLLIESCVHEMTHVFQSESGRLRTLSYGYWFEGFTYTFNFYYFDRPWEIEAFELESPLKYAVKDLMYTSNPNCLN